LCVETYPPHGAKYDTTYIAFGASATGDDNEACCQPEAVSFEKLTDAQKAEAERPLVGKDGGVIDPDVIWSCTNCGACVEECPVDIEHVDHIVDMRRYQVMMESEFPSELSTLFKNLETKGNPWGQNASDRTNWIDEVDFDVIYTDNGDVFDRYRIRLYEILESAKIVRQCVEKMPAGDYRVQDKKITPPPRARIDESMEALIHHFKLFTEGFKVPPGETYVAIESPRGEIGCYLVSDGSSRPVRMHIRGPSFYNLQSIDPMGKESLVADAVAIVSSIDPIMGEVDR